MRTKQEDFGLTQADGKVILLGEAGVGKSSIAMRLKDNKFVEGGHVPTVGAAYFQKDLTLQPKGPGQSDRIMRLHLWDTGGDERFRSVLKLYYRDAIGAIVCYDMGNSESFNAVKYWIDEIRENTSFEQGGFAMALVGNKCDLPIDKI